MIGGLGRNIITKVNNEGGKICKCGKKNLDISIIGAGASVPPPYPPAVALISICFKVLVSLFCTTEIENEPTALVEME